MRSKRHTTGAISRLRGAMDISHNIYPSMPRDIDAALHFIALYATYSDKIHSLEDSTEELVAVEVMLARLLDDTWPTHPQEESADAGE